MRKLKIVTKMCVILAYMVPLEAMKRNNGFESLFSETITENILNRVKGIHPRRGRT